MISSTGFWKAFLAKAPCTTQVGIVYQSVSEETSGATATALEDRPSTSGDSTSWRKRRRTFKNFDVDIKPYMKSSLELMLLEYTDWQWISKSYQLAKANDLLWMIKFSILPESNPMWVGWNAQHRIDKKSDWKGMVSSGCQSIPNIDSSC